MKSTISQKYKNPDKTRKSQYTKQKYVMLSSISQKTQKSRQDMEITMYKTEVCDAVLLTSRSRFSDYRI